MRSLIRIAFAAATIILAIVASGCGQHQSVVGMLNQPPTVTLTGAPAGAAASNQTLYELRWTGNDPDGRVDHFLITQNPRLIDGAQGWSAVADRARLLTLGRASRAVEERAALPEPTFFAVRAVDDRGAVSQPAVRAFVGDNVAPWVQIVLPFPSPLSPPLVPPTIRIQWVGNDPDGAVPSKLAKYKFHLYSQSDPEFALAHLNADSLRRLVAPAFTGWDSVPGDSLAHTFSGLTPDQDYLFAVVGFDDQGAYSAYFSLWTNLLIFHVVPIGQTGPQITVSGGGLVQQFAGGINDSLFKVRLQAPSREPLTIRWYGLVPNGGLSGYRWAIDIRDVNDETPRHGPLDVRHWSAWSMSNTSAIVTPLFPAPPSDTRTLTIEARDAVGFVTRVTANVSFLSVRRTGELLVVLDTRYAPEMKGPDGRLQVFGFWPCAAELDSFLFARGGVPLQGYAASGFSRPGLFSGYDFDVYRTATTALDKTVPLDLLMRYRNVVWITDGYVAEMSPASRDAYALRYMCRPGRQNPLEAYSNSGGRLWLLGGGVAYAMCKDLYNSTGNDFFTFTYSSRGGELVQGRAMYDFVHWRSELQDYVIQPGSFPTRTQVSPVGRRDVPDYSRMPARLDNKSVLTDSLPATRSAIPATFYTPNLRRFVEYLTQPNDILEGMGPFGDRGRQWVVLDSLYTVDRVAQGKGPFPAMTVYRGRENGMVIFTGFDLWTWQRPECRQMVDAVLGDLWRLRTTAATPTLAASGGGAPTQDQGMIRRR